MKDNCVEILEKVGHHQTPQRNIGRGENTLCGFYDASHNDYPADIVFATSLDEIYEEQDLGAQHKWSEIKVKRKYLWVIIGEHVRFALEATPAASERGCICHTNITGGEDAIIGGELWFLKNARDEFELHINFGSADTKPLMLILNIRQYLNCLSV